MQGTTNPVFMFAAIGVLILTLDTLRRYFTAKKRWSLGALVGQLVLLPLVAVGGGALILLYVLPMFSDSRP